MIDHIIDKILIAISQEALVQLEGAKASETAKKGITHSLTFDINSWIEQEEKQRMLAEKLAAEQEAQARELKALQQREAYGLCCAVCCCRA